MGVGGERHAPAAGWAPEPAGQVRKISPPRGFEPQTVQPAVSRYNDDAIPGHQ